MKQSRNLINNLMEQYLGDLDHFGEGEDYAVCESFFNRTKNVLNESEESSIKVLSESAQNDHEKVLVEDFKLYIKQVLNK